MGRREPGTCLAMLSEELDDTRGFMVRLRELSKGRESLLAAMVFKKVREVLKLRPLTFRGGGGGALTSA